MPLRLRAAATGGQVEEAARQARPNGVLAAGPGKAVAVLLVEGDALLRGSLARRLDRAGIQVMEVASAAEALSLAVAGPAPTVLVASTRLGAGWGAASFIGEAKRRWPHLRTLLVSGGGLDSQSVLAADCTLLKPFGGQAFMQAVTELIKRA